METKHIEKARTTVPAILNIRCAIWRQYSSEEKLGMFLEGLRSKNSIVELCLREGINQNQYYRWSKEFTEDRATRRRTVASSMGLSQKAQSRKGSQVTHFI